MQFIFLMTEIRVNGHLTHENVFENEDLFKIDIQERKFAVVRTLKMFLNL